MGGSRGNSNIIGLLILMFSEWLKMSPNVTDAVQYFFLIRLILASKFEQQKIKHKETTRMSPAFCKRKTEFF